MQYRVIHSTNITEFENEVIEHLSQGWELVAGVSTSVAIHYDNTFEYSYAQAMIYDTEDIYPISPTNQELANTTVLP